MTATFFLPLRCLLSRENNFHMRLAMAAANPQHTTEQDSLFALFMRENSDCENHIFKAKGGCL
jgi:hypothetical protein